MKKPIDATVAELVDMLDDNLREMFEERAGIRQHLAGFSQAHAEALALLDVVNRHPDALSGVTVFAFELDGTTHWVVTTDRDYARRNDAGGAVAEVRRADLAAVLDERYFGAARLVALRT
jgi:hypothetical protein